MKDKIYKVTWTDASSVTDDTRTWLTLDESVETAKELYKSNNVSVGMILYKDKKILVIAGSRADDVYSDLTMIPACNVVKIKELK